MPPRQFLNRKEHKNHNGALALLSALLPSHLIDFVFHLLAEPLDVWDNLLCQSILAAHINLRSFSMADLISRRGSPEGFKWPGGFVMFEPII